MAFAQKPPLAEFLEMVRAELKIQSYKDSDLEQYGGEFWEMIRRGQWRGPQTVKRCAIDFTEWVLTPGRTRTLYYRRLNQQDAYESTIESRQACRKRASKQRVEGT